MLFAAVLALVGSLVAVQPQTASPTPDAWMAYRFLLGAWTGEGQGQPGDTTGRAVFKLDLDGRVIVRTNEATVPPAAGRPGYQHKDLLVMYRDAPGQPVKAIYWDNEDHTIEYDVTAGADGKSVTLVSRVLPSAPRFRLVYTKLDDSRVDVKFEMAPPGSPDAFKTYTQGITHRVK